MNDAPSLQLDPASADLTLLQDRQVAVLGYDDVAAAHALNLRDSGVDVRVGAVPDGRLAARAESDGLFVVTPAEAIAAADIVLVTEAVAGNPTEARAAQDLLEAHCEPGDLVIVTSGAAAIQAPEGVDLTMIAAMGDGRRLREEYLDGRGCPVLVAVGRDDSGAALATLTAYAAAMGSLRSGALLTTMDHHATAESFAEVAVHALTQRVVEDAFDTLVTAGIEPEVAYLSTLHALKTRTDEVYAAGFSSQHGPSGRSSHDAAAAAALVPGLADRMRDLLTDPGSGQGAQEGPTDTADSARPPADAALTSRRAAAAAAHPLELVGRRVRAMMSWIRS